ncbi:hypothetical protein [Crossiella cryophila]|uniref:Uncharacterized protein n=1 Tax=Crossiella cryophila TaxID=43355 RepID=A0A7W7CHA0_9PSEU|nr:hypothetical protein [Crossiella cryophila]MBB4679756.1 hypothetical protein [Crossiella cryophila]
MHLPSGATECDHLAELPPVDAEPDLAPFPADPAAIPPAAAPATDLRLLVLGPPRAPSRQAPATAPRGSTPETSR